MAHMIPPKPKEFEASSKEGIVFNAFSNLSPDYYVFHSYTVIDVNPRNDFIERELDFVIANQNKGILCLEVKAGRNISYHDRTWYYSSGDIMPHGGPYNQIATAKRALSDKIRFNKNEEIQKIYSKCKIMHAVLFVDMSERDFKRLEGLPEEACVDITMFAEDLAHPARKIADIFSKSLSWEKYVSSTKMTDDEFKLLLDGVLCPHFRLIPSPAAKNTLVEERLNQLLKEQYRILDFLEEQDTAIVNGAAGTGKTMIAVEKARRHSINGEKVLFLCYNRMLCDDLIKKHKESQIKSYRKQFENVDFMTISKLAKEITGSFNNYEDLLLWAMECSDKSIDFPYRHVIIDEGQDFGIIDTEVGNDNPNGHDGVSIIDALQEAALENGGTFYLFYDKYQMIQGKSDIEYVLPNCINDADCRLTLHCNCRNTKEIAKTSVTTLKEKKNKAIKAITACSWEEPTVPSIHLIKNENDTINVLNNIIRDLSKDGIDDIIILTSNSINESSIGDYIDINDRSDASYELDGKIYIVTTCKKFKGLEADAIIFYDLDKNSFKGKQALEFYVGTSRAKLHLDMICKLEESDYCDVVHELDENAPQMNNPSRMRNILGSIFSADIIME